MKTFTLITWTVTGLFSIFFSSGFLAVAQYEAQTKYHTKFTFNFVLNNYPSILFIVFLIFAFDLFTVLYRIKISITDHEIIVHHMFRKYTFHKTIYHKKDFILRIESARGDNLIHPNFNKYYVYWIVLRSNSTKIKLTSFVKFEFKFGQNYISNLIKNYIHYDPNINTFFNLDDHAL